MAGLVPAIHVFLSSMKEDVDARHKAGHDVEKVIVIPRQSEIRTQSERCTVSTR